MNSQRKALALASALAFCLVLASCAVSSSPAATEFPTYSDEPTPSESVTDTASADPSNTETFVAGNVPDVVDYEEEEATAILEDAGFVVEVDYVDSDYEDDGYVLDQDPMGGSDADPGSTITLEVGSAE